MIAHIIGSGVFLLLGALQFMPSLRRRRWHRVAGRIVAPAGLLSGLSAHLDDALLRDPPTNGTALVILRLGFGTAMAVGIVIAIVAILRRDVRAHSAWMTRAYAIGLGAGTQVLTFFAWTLLVGAPDHATYAVPMGAGWVINLAVAEIVIHRRARRSTRFTRVTSPPAAPRAHLS